MSATRDAHRYWNKAKGGYSCKFVPFAYVFTKSETKEVFEFAHKTLRWTASELIGVLLGSPRSSPTRAPRSGAGSPS